MRKWCVSVWGACCFCSAFAQSPCDSLESRYQELLSKDEPLQAWEACEAFSECLFETEGDSSLRYAVSLRWAGNRLRELDRLDEADSLYAKSMAMLTQQGRQLSPDFGSALNNLGVNESDRGDFARAEEYYLQALEIEQTVWGDDDPEVATNLDILGMNASDRGDYARAEEYYLQALEIRRAALGDTHPDVASTLYNLGVNATYRGDYARAEEYLLQALEIEQAEWGDDDPEVATTLYALGVNATYRGGYARAEEYYQQALEIEQAFFGDDDPEVAITLHALGRNAYDRGDLARADQYFLQALEIQQAELGDSHPEVTMTLNDLGEKARELGDHARAEEYFLQALEIQQAFFGDDDPEVATTLDHLGMNAIDRSDLARAEEYLLQALEIRRAALGDTHPDVANSLIYLGTLALYRSDYARADEFCLQALEIRRAALGDTHPDVVETFYELGVNATYRGDYARAEEYLLQALEINRAALGDSHPDVVLCLTALGLNADRSGDYVRAGEYLLQALEIQQAELGDTHHKVASRLTNLGLNAANLGDYARAEEYLQKALEIRRAALGDTHPLVAESLINLGVNASDRGDYARAEEYYLQALEIFRATFGDTHPDVAMSLNNLGVNAMDRGDYARAEEYWLQALEIYRAALGDTHPKVAMTLNILSGNASDMGDYRHAEVWLREVLEIKQRWLMEQFTGLSRSERKMLWTEERSFLQNTASLAVKASQDGNAAQAKRTAALAYEAALFGKGLLLETSKALQAALSAAGDSVLLGTYETLVSSRRVLTQQRALPESERDATVVAFHESRAATAEKMLSRALPAFNEARANQVIAFQDVVKSLDAGEAAIEFVSFEDADNGSTYAALVATPGQKWPLCIPLENAEPWVLGWDTLALAEAQYEAINRDLGLLYDVLWRPLVPALRDARRVYVSGTGVFDRLPLHALYTAGTGAGSRDYVGDLWDIRLVASTRDLVRTAFKQPIAVEPELLAYGYVNYNAIPPALPEVAPDNQEQLAWFGSEPGWRRDGREWGPLPTLAGTEIELYRIEQALKTGGWRSTMRSELSASEHQLKADLQAQRPGVLHFATHGFAYLNPYQEEDFHQFKEGELGEATRFRTTFRVGEDPFDRTGLMLAGGNFSWTGMPQAMMDQTGEDGVLTASEVSDFDLSGTGVVVLSACETGLGTLDATEGAQGLHLAFKLAGADAVIQSLWAVPDVETKDLMARFYEELAASGDVEASFAAARNAMREDAILAEKPAYWAAFVMKR